MADSPDDDYNTGRVTMATQTTSATPWVEINDYSPEIWTSDRARVCCEQLEANQILFFARPPFLFSDSDRAYFLSQKSSDSRLHKNVSYRPASDVLRGFGGDDRTCRQMHDTMRNFSLQVVGFVKTFLAPYASKLQLDYASFRPIEEEGRNLPLHKRNDLLHVDAFPSRPTRGGRILRVFTNISEKARVWITTDRFPVLAERFAREAGLPKIAATSGWRGVRHLLHGAGVPIPDRSAYDEFMLHFHDWLKENTRFQTECVKEQIEFPPMSTWLVYTDGVPHAVLSGQYALEQTFIVPREALVTPQVSPIRVLEELAGAGLAG